MMELNSWLLSIAQRRWPILPGTLGVLRQACARHSDLIEFTDLANITLSDPLLLFDLIRVIGGSRAMQRSECMPSVEQSIILIGLDAVINRYIKLIPLQAEAEHLHPVVVEEISLWLARGRVAAMIVKDWLSLCGEHKFEDCYISALIYNLPACFYLMYRNRPPTGPLLQEVAETFSLDYPKLLEQFVWAIPLPLGLLKVLSTQGKPDRRKLLLRLAVATANGLSQGAWRSQWLAGIDTAAKLIGVKPEVAYQAVPLATLSIARRPRAVSYTYPVRELLMLPGDLTQGELSAVASLNEAGELETALREGLRFCSNELHFKRVLFLRYDQEHHYLKLRYQVGLEESHPLRKTAIDLEPGSFFSLLTSKAQSFRAPAMARAQLQKRYLDPFFSLLNGGDFATMTLFSGPRLEGVFYVDNGHLGATIDDATYQRFKGYVTRLAHQK